MPEIETESLGETLLELERQGSEAPLLALGQTVFWDEPMKAGVALQLRRMGLRRTFLAGVHDTDYFAKLPSGRHDSGKFVALPHNDTTTRGLWSAAGEFSALFGSETVVTRDALTSAGLRIERVAKARPGFLDQATEAWGWRGIVSMDEVVPVTAELPLEPIFASLMETFEWAVESSLASLDGQGLAMARRQTNELKAEMRALAETPGQTLSGYYQSLLKPFYEFSANASLDLETTATSELLQFNPDTCHRPRFELLDLFIRPETRERAAAAYDQAIQGSAGLYELARFGTGAIPFDLVIPGHGRGTIRIGNRGAVIMTRRPQFLSYKTRPNSVQEFAEAVAAKFGPDCVLVGKAVTLIGMLAREFVFVFHEGASGYVKHSRKLHQILGEVTGSPLALNPILRVRYDAWDALRVCCSWLRLPEPFQRPFGTEELCGPSFAERWRDVQAQQTAILQKLGTLRRPIELIRYLEETQGSSWSKLAEEYEGLHRRLGSLTLHLQRIRETRDHLYDQMRELRKERVEAERQKGEHFRARIFERDPRPEDLQERERLSRQVVDVVHRLTESETQMREARHEQFALIENDEVRQVHERRHSIELEAELKRARLIRSAVIASKGLEASGRRPSAWWFRIVCPDGLWFRETVDQAQCYLEPLV